MTCLKILPQKPAAGFFSLLFEDRAKLPSTLSLIENFTGEFLVYL